MSQNLHAAHTVKGPENKAPLFLHAQPRGARLWSAATRTLRWGPAWFPWADTSVLSPCGESNLLVSVLTASKHRTHSREIPLKSFLQVTRGEAGPEEGLGRSSHASRCVYGHQVSIPGRRLQTKPSRKGISCRPRPSCGVRCTCEALRPTGAQLEEIITLK